MDSTSALQAFYRRPACTSSACPRQEGLRGIKGIRDDTSLILPAKPALLYAVMSRREVPLDVRQFPNNTLLRTPVFSTHTAWCQSSKDFVRGDGMRHCVSS